MNSRITSRRRRSSRLGFSLIELMVSLAVGGVALTSIYSIGAASTRQFRAQQRIANTQTAVRMAMDQLKRDIQRAGFLGSPNASLTQEACGSPPAGGTAAAIVAFADDVGVVAAGVGGSPVVDPAQVNPGATVDDITLMGNYSTTGEYPVLSASGSSVVLNPNWQSFRRDFNAWDDAITYDSTAFSNAFLPGRMVRVHTLSEKFHFAELTANTPATYALAINPAIQADCSASGSWVSPLNAIRYHVIAADNTSITSDEGARLTTSTETIGLLRRTEMNSSTPRTTLMAGGLPVDDRTVLDYVVAFNVTFRSAAGTAFTWGRAPNTTQTAAKTALIANNPQNVRSVIVDLAARSPEQDPNLTLFTTLPMRTFRVLDTTANADKQSLAARVRTAHAEILLPNVAYRHITP